MLFVNKLKVLTLMTCLVLVGQGFAMDAWIDHKSAKAPEKVNECYLITSPAELAWFAKNVNDNKTPYCAKVMADLDMGGYHWIPISAKGTQRAVNFDGNGKIIRNLYISAEEILKKYPNDRQYAQNLGLIGAFTGHVQKVILENVEVYAYGNGYVSGNKDNEKSPLSIGTVVGWQANPNSIVENCYVTGKMVTSGDGQAVGGIVGNNGGGTIRNCYSEVNIDASGTAYVGGIAGYTKAYTGGAVATISSCVYAGNTLSSTGSGAAGAIVGNHYDGTTAFENVYYDSDIFGNNSIGRTRAGDTTGSPTGESELNSALIACTLNGGEMVDGVCTKDSPWSDAATSISLNGYGADGYKITFNANGGSFAGGATFVKYVKAGNTINNDGVANPVWGDDSYVFAGWSGDDYNKAATKATTITASWNKMHTITFSPVNGDLHGTFPDGSSESVSIKVENGKRIAVQGFERPTTFTDAQNVKYNFMGWANGDDPTILYVENGLDNLPLATEDMTLVAAWTTAPVFTVRFYEDETSTASYVSSVYENEHATELTVDKMDPHPGYTFEGWFERDAENSFDFTQNITSDVDLFAKWTKNTYTVNYVLNCSDECTNSNADEFTVDGMPLSDPEWNEKYRFLGWYADAEFKDKKTSIPSGLTDDITLYAEWETITYDITYRAGAYGTGLVAAEKKIHNEAYTLRDTSYTRKGYLQSGWVSEEGLTYAFGDEYSANAPLIIYPTWEIIPYTISYTCSLCDISDESVYPRSYNVENSFGLPFPTVEDGYSFVGWYKDSKYKNKVVNVQVGSTGNLKLYGKVLEQYIITYVGADDSYGDKTYTIESGAQLRTAAPRAGYTFAGWFENEDLSGVAVTEIPLGSTGDKTFYAKWIPDTYTVTYDAGEFGEGSIENGTKTHDVDFELSTEKFTRSGYTQDGWENINGDVVSSPYTENADITLYPHWIASYTITYVDADGLENPNPTSYTVLENDLELQPVSKSGFKFLGWFNENDELVESISAGSTGDITLTAKWAVFPVLVSTYGGIQIFENEDKTKTAVIDGTSEETVIIPTADNVSVDQVVFNRDFSGGVKSTVMFPFTVSLNDVGGGDFWEFLAMEYSSETGWLFRIKEPDDNELKANKPYIFIADQESKNIEFNLSSSVSLSTDAMNPSVHNGWAFKGVYEKVSFNEVHPEWKYAYGYSGEQKRNVTKGSFIRLKSTGFEKIDLAPMRAYLVYDKSLAKSARISDNANIGSLPEFIDVEIVGKKGLAIGGGVLNTTTGELKMDRWYDLRGRKLNGKPTTQGTYYYNGKRIIVR